MIRLRRQPPSIQTRQPPIRSPRTAGLRRRRNFVSTRIVTDVLHTLAGSSLWYALTRSADRAPFVQSLGKNIDTERRRALRFNSGYTQTV